MTTTPGRVAVLTLVAAILVAPANASTAAQDLDGTIIKSEKQSVKLEVIAKGLETPWGMAFLPDGRLLVTERPGRLRIIDKGTLLPPVKGTPDVWVRQDGGLFDVEVHPQYAKTGWIYLSYSEVKAGTPAAGRGDGPSVPSMTVIVRGKIKDNTWIDQQVLFRGTPDLYTVADLHYGSRFTFDTAGHLFFSLGDKGTPENAQDLTKPTGKVHRVNDDGSVPKDNPFVNTRGAVGSIWTYGHRNPQGLSWDPATGKLWETEHGPTGGDELNLLEAGHNYGWAVVSNGSQPGITATAKNGMDSPKAFWTPSIGPAGIAFAAGTTYPGWKNSVFIAALTGQQLRRVEIAKDIVTHQEVVFKEYGRARDIIVGPDGYFYVAVSLPGQRVTDTTAGAIVRMIPVK